MKYIKFYFAILIYILFYIDVLFIKDHTINSINIHLSIITNIMLVRMPTFIYKNPFENEKEQFIHNKFKNKKTYIKTDKNSEIFYLTK